MKPEELKIEVNESLIREQSLESLLKCCLCGTELMFFHKMDYATMHIVEEPKCPACGIRHKTSTHKVQ